MNPEMLGFLLPILAAGVVFLLMARLLTAALKIVLLIALIAAALTWAGVDWKTPLCGKAVPAVFCGKHSHKSLNR